MSRFIYIITINYKNIVMKLITEMMVKSMGREHNKLDKTHFIDIGWRKISVTPKILMKILEQYH